MNGGVLAMDYSVGTRVTYFCNDGYRLSSKELTSAVCQPDGTWSNHNKVPRCSGTGPLIEMQEPFSMNFTADKEIKRQYKRNEKDLYTEIIPF